MRGQIRSGLGWQRGMTQRIVGWVAIVLLVAGAIALPSCSTVTSQKTPVSQLVLTSLSDPKTFNAIMSEEQNDVLGLLYEGLLSQNGVTGELEPGLAEAWEISADNLSIIFTLREGLQWSDGQPFTVDDVLFTYNDILFNPKIPTSNQDLLRIGEAGAFPKVTQVGDRRVEFRSPEPFAPLLRFAGLGVILPKHALAQSVRTTNSEGQPLFVSTWGTDTPPKQIIGTGPYQLASYQPTQRAIVSRNPHYWRKDAKGNSLPYIDRVVLQIVESTDNSLMQFRSGGVDVESITPDYFALIKREEERGDFTIYNGGPRFSTLFLTFNLNQGKRNGQPLVDPIKSRWFNQLEFRRAIAHAIDRQTMINNVYQGLGALQHSPIYKQSPYYFPPEKGLPTYDFDLEKARQLLQSVGFQYNAAGELLDAEGNRVRFTLVTNSGNKIREAVGAQIKRDLAAIGILVDFQPIAFNTLVDKMDSSLDWEAMIMGLSGAGVEPAGGINVWSPSGRLHVFNQLPGEGQEPIEGRVVTDWEEEIGRLYVQGSQVLDEEERKAIYAKTQVLAQEYVPLIFLVNPYEMAAVRNHIQNVKFSALGGALWNLYELQLAQ